MLMRVLEPEVMDSTQEALDYDAMDHGDVNRVFVDDLLIAAHDLLGGVENGNTENDHTEIAGVENAALEILDLGTGAARIPLELCSRLEGCRVLAVDLSTAMLDVARVNIELAGLMACIQLDHQDAKQLDYDDERFPLLISNSIIHHIPAPSQVVAEMARVTAPGGCLFVRDLMRPDDDQTLDQLVQTYAGNETPAARQMFADSLRAALRLEEMQEIVARLGFAPENVTATSDRHWTWSAGKQMSP